jgi:hypothetical protein
MRWVPGAGVRVREGWADAVAEGRGAGSRLDSATQKIINYNCL